MHRRRKKQALINLPRAKSLLHLGVESNSTPARQKNPTLTRTGSQRGLVARRTIEYWRYNKKGPPFIRIGRRVLYPLPGVIAWERRRTIHADLLKQLGV
jgi:hypothetical protein